MAPSWATVFYWLAGFPHTYCLLPHKAWSKSTWTDTVTPSILTTPWWQANTLWSRHLFHLLFHCWKHFSYSVLRISESSCIVLCLFLIGGNTKKSRGAMSGKYGCDTPVEYDVWLRMLHKLGWVHWCVLSWWICLAPDLFFGLCCELHHSDVLVFLNKYSALQFPCGACSWCTVPSWFKKITFAIQQTLHAFLALGGGDVSFVIMVV